jgi:hypothetical protein
VSISNLNASGIDESRSGDEVVLRAPSVNRVGRRSPDVIEK